MGTRARSLQGLLAVLALGPLLEVGGWLAPLPSARAELPPWVYGQEQRQAPLRLELEVLTVQTWPADQPDQLRVQARVLAVMRQPRGGHLRPGDRLQLRYAIPPQHPGGWVGPAPLPWLKAGQRVPAWLAPDPDAPGTYRPAAGGRSFGPSMEAFRGDQT
ncbi:MAG: hypothetical protein ACKO5M_04775 [Vulcanococcus sp.]